MLFVYESILVCLCSEHFFLLRSPISPAPITSQCSHSQAYRIFFPARDGKVCCMWRHASLGGLGVVNLDVLRLLLELEVSYE